MIIIHQRCAGLDVHKRTVVACCLWMLQDGTRRQETRSFGTTTAQLLQLLDWLQAWEITCVAMESTGEYWKPIFNILEGNLEILLVNAQHVKAVPGRKTDVKDAQWLAELLQHGLLRASFIPPREQRDLRDLTRQRSNIVRERASVVNQLQKVLESANIKLASVATDVTGKSAKDMLLALAEGAADPNMLAQLARGRMRQKREALQEALQGQVREHHRFLLTQQLTHLDFLDEQIALFDAEIARHIHTHLPSPEMSEPESSKEHPSDAFPEGKSPDAAPLSWAKAVELLDTIPGVNQRIAEVVIAELGTDMSRFPSASHLASWAGLSPGNHQSAGKQRTGQISAGDRPIRKYLVQAANAAAKSKTSYLGALYARLATRRGRKRALIAVAHAILISIYHMLSRQEAYQDLGYGYLDQRKHKVVTNQLVRRLERLGYQVHLSIEETIPATPVELAG